MNRLESYFCAQEEKPYEELLNAYRECWVPSEDFSESELYTVKNATPVHLAVILSPIPEREKKGGIIGHISGYALMQSRPVEQHSIDLDRAALTTAFWEISKGSRQIIGRCLCRNRVADLEDDMRLARKQIRKLEQGNATENAALILHNETELECLRVRRRLVKQLYLEIKHGNGPCRE